MCLALLLMLLPTGEDAEGNGNGYSRHLGAAPDSPSALFRAAALHVLDRTYDADHQLCSCHTGITAAVPLLLHL